MDLGVTSCVVELGKASCGPSLSFPSLSSLVSYAEDKNFAKLFY